MAAFAGYSSPQFFGRIGALSPSIWWADRQLVAFVTEQLHPPGVRSWVDMGAAEYASGISDLGALVAALVADGFVRGVDLQVVEAPGAEHDEAAWRARLPDVVRFLFPR